MKSIEELAANILQGLLAGAAPIGKEARKEIVEEAIEYAFELKAALKEREVNPGSDRKRKT